jgi:gamma-glutamyl-gamma-aminobutyrate hydrolase PuuD
MNKAISAGNNYNDSLSKLNLMNKNMSSDVNRVHRDYINNTIEELELKLEAVDNLKEAIECFEVNYNYTGTNYGYEANDLMDRSLEYRNARDSLVRDNPNLFKEDFII